MKEGYALLFHNLIFTMCNMARPVIGGDIRKAYYCDVDKFLNEYGMQLGLGGHMDKSS